MSINKSYHHVHRGIARSAGIIGVATLCSRILGFIRDIIIARLFGVYVYAQAFVIAFKIPNLLRDLVGEGATNAAVVPVFSEYRLKHSDAEFWELVNTMLNIVLVVVSAITLAGIIFSPVIVRLIAPGFINSPETFNATVMLNRLIFPYIIFVSLTAYGMGVLNSLKHFSVPAFGPCLLNLSIIFCALFWGEGIAGLATGILIGGVLQMAIQLPVLYKKGFRLRLFRRFRHPAAKEIGMLLVPRLASSSIYQLNNFVDSIFGSFSAIVGQGGVAILYFAYRLIQFPLGIFSNSISQAILPAFSTQALEETRDNLKKTLSFGLRLVFFVMVPASIGLIIFSRPIVSSLFEGGRFDAYSSMETSRVLLFYSIGLCAYGGNKIVSSCFFALKDTVTPTKVSAAALIMNIILNSILMFPLKLCGLALATSVSGITSFVLLLYLLVKKIGGFSVREIMVSFLKIMAAGAGMGCICFFAGKTRFFSGTCFAAKTAHLITLVGSGIISYTLFCFLFRVGEMNSLIALIRKRHSH